MAVNLEAENMALRAEKAHLKGELEKAEAERDSVQVRMEYWRHQYDRISDSIKNNTEILLAQSEKAEAVRELERVRAEILVLADKYPALHGHERQGSGLRADTLLRILNGGEENDG